MDQPAFGDRFRVERELGSGGMATVWLATDLRYDRPVAIKALREDVASTLGSERFLREIRLTARLDHPHIVPLLDSGEHEGTLFYVMPFVEGESLRDRLSREKQLPVAVAVQVATEVLDALAYAHDRGLVHRDIKPENVLLSDGHARVADFGISRAVAASGAERLTRTGVAVGTPAYMSPELAAGDHDLDRRSDLYAVGCLLYEMLAGQPPFTGPTAESVVLQHMAATPPAVTQHRPAVPPSVAGAIDRALAKTPADRFDSAGSFSRALAGPPVVGEAMAPGLVHGAAGREAGPGGGAGPSHRKPPRWPRRIALAVAVLAVVVVAVWGSVWRNRGAAIEDRPLVAVLPFRNLGPPEDEYFADGITEEITSRLGRISGIGVISRTTATRYKGSTRSLREIARELGVQYVLEGTIRTEHLPDGTGRVRVNPDLIRADDDTHIWTDSYTAGLAPGEIFSLQSEIAGQVAEAFHVSLLATERAAVGRQETGDSAAYRHYLLGRFLLANSERVTEAIPQFDSALARDPEYARAWAGLADAYLSLPYYVGSGTPDSVAYGRAADAARRAIALDESSAEAHAALGRVLAEGEWRWADAERELMRAIEIDRDDAAAYSRLTMVLDAQGRADEALAAARRALELEPASAGGYYNRAYQLSSLGRLDEAVADYRQALAIEPAYLGPHIGLAEVAAQRGDLAEMSRELAQLSFEPALSEAMLAYATDADDASKREALVREIDAVTSPNPALDEARKGWLFAAIGEGRRALDALERAVDRRSPPGISVVRMRSVRTELGPEPRYQELLRRIGYPPE